MAAQFQQRRRGPVGGRLELLELGDRAGRGDFKSVRGQLERRPAQRLEIDQSVRGDLWRREQPSAAGKIGITRLPPGNFVGGGGALDRGNVFRFMTVAPSLWLPKCHDSSTRA